MQIHLLGPVEASSDDCRVALGGPKPRALLAMLALEAGTTVSAERLIDGLWGDEPPATAAKMVQLYVSQLRKAMAAHGEDDAIATHGRGYQLQLRRDRVDAGRFERLLAQGAPREALRLWRGPALADVADEPFAAPEIRRLDELRASAIEVAVDQDLDAGRHREVLPELEALLAHEPLRERLHAQRMLALYRSGRQAEALEAYRQARATLVEQIGIEPGPDLRRLHEAILRQDPSLDPPGQEAVGAPLVGRDTELARLRELWRRARAGSGTSVLVAGPPGMGETRLVQELAVEVRREGGTVVHGEVDDARGPTLLVLDDVAAASEVPPDLPVLAVATAVRPTAAATRWRWRRSAATTSPRWRAITPVRGPRPTRRSTASSESGGIPARVHRAAAAWARAVATRRVGEAAERASAERAGWRLTATTSPTEVVELQTLRERGALAGSGFAAHVPLQGAGGLRFRRRGLLLRPGAPGRRARRALDRQPGPGDRRGVGQRQVVGVAGRLLPALAEGSCPAVRLGAALMRPGAHPSRRASSGTGRRTRAIVLAVDQFEETFAACEDERERRAFIEARLLARRAGRRSCCRPPRRLLRALQRLSRVRGPAGGQSPARRPDASGRAAPRDRGSGRARRPGCRAGPRRSVAADVESQPGGLPLLPSRS